MIHFDLPKQKSSIIKVLGVGGGGSNAVNFMFSQNIEGVDFIICNTDSKALDQSRIPNKIQLGPHLTQGLGAGANPEIGKQATEESLEEIKKILEVNTKMAFICAGMGGGTGTGGAPIVAKICRDLGILTVGIVTTPFGFEGPRRQQQAELGIKELKPYVDTLLVISNDKLRMQYGNLKMREAFCKADNVLATAAKCITDIINSTGHIIVDFADVCTVMKNGGVAILGKSEMAGEDRAQRAIEEALNSPLLNDSDIKGAKWILININSAEGDHECTMDELEIINSYLRMQAGENSDVIVGTGYDNTLDDKISITLIATGFEHKDPFAKTATPVMQAPKPKQEKILMTLSLENEEKKVTAATPAQPLQQQTLTFEDKDVFAPSLSDASQPIFNTPVAEEPINSIVNHSVETYEEKQTIRFELTTEISAPVELNPVMEEKPEEPQMQLIEKPEQSTPVTTSMDAGFLRRPTNIYAAFDQPQQPAMQPSVQPQPMQQPEPVVNEVPKPQEPQVTFIPSIAANQPPINLDAYFHTQQSQQNPTEQQPQQKQPTASPFNHHEEEQVDFGFVIKEDATTSNHAANANMIYDESEDEQKRRAAERIQKLRNLSYNLNSNDPNNEFETVPAYIRRNMDLFGNTLTSAEQFYSKYTVKADENNENGQISTLNTFLDGKKPD